MPDRDSGTGTTQREYVEFGGAVVGGRPLTGCSGGGDETPTERGTKHPSPEQIGEWTGVGETLEGEQLFDQQRVVDVIIGGFE